MVVGGSAEPNLSEGWFLSVLGWGLCAVLSVPPTETGCRRKK